ncbi:unnamed protein product [Linum trigynum]|uniref:Uncharacterized protein n=1 Tax=Linum trigynum TaxID=586398 RepID=A0AAV2DKP7_9ROSI
MLVEVEEDDRFDMAVPSREVLGRRNPDSGVANRQRRWDLGKRSNRRTVQKVEEDWWVMVRSNRRIDQNVEDIHGQEEIWEEP